MSHDDDGLKADHPKARLHSSDSEVRTLALCTRCWVPNGASGVLTRKRNIQLLLLKTIGELPRHLLLKIFQILQFACELHVFRPLNYVRQHRGSRLILLLSTKALNNALSLFVQVIYWTCAILMFHFFFFYTAILQKYCIFVLLWLCD